MIDNDYDDDDSDDVLIYYRATKKLVFALELV